MNADMERPKRKTIKHFDEPGHVHELTFSCYRRRPLLTDSRCCRMFCEALNRANARHRYRLFGFVIMPEHVHLLVQPLQNAGLVSDLLRAIKRPFSYRIKHELQAGKPAILEELTIRQRPGVTTFRFWQEGPGYDRNLVDRRTLLRSVDYLHQNPVRRGLCQRAIDWKWSSARCHLLPEEPRDPDLPKLTRLPADLLD
jgi:putative transposase